MIILTRLGGHEMAVNPDLIERAEATPDTVITMVDGHKLVVAESLTELVTRVRHWRASVAAEAYLTARSQGLRGPVAAPPMSEGEDPESVDGHVSEISAADVIAHGLSSSAMARVLRMPKREG